MQAGLGEIADLLRASSTPATARRKLAAWSKSKTNAIYDHVGDAIFVPAVMSDLAGQLMVYGREARTIKLDASSEVTAFLDLPWEEALREWRARGLMSPDDFDTMLRDYAQRSDTARRLMLEQVQTLVRAKLDAAIVEGTSLKQFADEIQDGTAKLGLTAQDPVYLETVARTNIQAAYGAGRFRAMTDPVVIDARPFVQYRTVGDALVRPSHQMLDGIEHGTCYHAASTTWHRIAPPNGFRCRCSCVTLSREEAKGLEVLGEIPVGGEPDAGFDGPPVAQLDA